LRGEDSLAALCRRESIHPNLYYNWSKEFMEAGKKRLSGDTQRQATSNEVISLRLENDELKKIAAELLMELRTAKKNPSGIG
jgi:transposase